MSYLCQVFISLLSDCSSSPEDRGLSPAVPQLLRSETLTQMEHLCSQGCCFTEIRLRWRSAQLWLPPKEPEQPSIIKSYLSTVMLTNTPLHMQVKFDKRELFNSLEVPGASLFLVFALSLSFFFLSPLPAPLQSTAKMQWFKNPVEMLGHISPPVGCLECFWWAIL